ncbi:DUF4287 domain-containing protein [Sphingomonas sp. BIUV-7]|uniref:DUF4287 domain-containing protein n=1 Tax=Sphingomonas natans TaxID=3063330 RepID=A0ABT8Y7G6_9SPHN|nr:DUF4287 domain-containing protein [Sphingomonas sp. BIUV-7]MDO6414244.1 DUF4287 domain-containing protein [Sphingomonas sp. BIUV-7]
MNGCPKLESNQRAAYDRVWVSAIELHSDCTPPRVGRKCGALAGLEFGVVADDVGKGSASYFPSIEKKYGKPIAEWQELVRQNLPAKPMELVSMLKSDHGMGHGHAKAVVSHALADRS